MAHTHDHSGIQKTGVLLRVIGISSKPKTSVASGVIVSAWKLRNKEDDQGF